MRRYASRQFSLRDQHGGHRFRNPFYPERYIKRKKIYPKTVLFILCAFIFTLGTLGVFHPRMRIHAIEVTPVRFNDGSVIQAYIEEALKGKTAYLLPRAHLLFVRPNTLATEVKKRFFLKNVHIKRQWSTARLKIIIDEYTGAATVTAGNQTFLATDGGEVLQMAPDTALLIALPHITVSSTMTRVPIQGEMIVPEYAVRAVKEIIDTFNAEYPLQFTSFTFDANDPTKLAANAREGWKLYIDPHKEITPQVYSAITVLKQKFPRPPRKFEYIDARFGNRLFYK